MRDLKGNLTIGGEKEITFSNFDELQLKSLLRYCFEISSRAN